MCPVGRDALSHRSRRLPSPLDDKVPRIFETFSLRRENALIASSRASKREPEVRRRPPAMVATRRRTPRRSACNNRGSLRERACNDRRESTATLFSGAEKARDLWHQVHNAPTGIAVPRYLAGDGYPAIQASLTRSNAGNILSQPVPPSVRVMLVADRAVRARRTPPYRRLLNDRRALRATACGPARRAHTAMKVSARSTH
jgi:hypothetical protein